MRTSSGRMLSPGAAIYSNNDSGKAHSNLAPDPHPRPIAHIPPLR